MKVQLGQEISDHRLDTIIRLFDGIHGDRVEFIDFSRTKKILPAGEVILFCLLDKIIEVKSNLKITGVSSDLKKHKAVQVLLDFYQSKTMPQPSDVVFQSEALMLQAVQQNIDFGFLDAIDENFEGQIIEDQLWYIRLLFNELMQNSLDHSTAERYFLYVGLWEEEIHFGIADLGVTIPAKLEQKYDCQDDVDYLQLSLKENIGTRRLRSGGLGLFHLFEVLKQQEGRLVLLSRDAQVRKYFQRRKTDAKLLKHRLRGTWCFARMPREKV